jgi:hypothetical protein
MGSIVNHFAAAGIDIFSAELFAEMLAGVALISRGLSGMNALLRKSFTSTSSMLPTTESTSLRDWSAGEEELRRRTKNR